MLRSHLAGIAKLSCLPQGVLVYTRCPSIMMNSTPLPLKKCPALGDELPGHLKLECPGVHSRKSTLTYTFHILAGSSQVKGFLGWKPDTESRFQNIIGGKKERKKRPQGSLWSVLWSSQWRGAWPAVSAEDIAIGPYCGGGSSSFLSL